MKIRKCVALDEEVVKRIDKIAKSEDRSFSYILNKIAKKEKQQ